MIRHVRDSGVQALANSIRISWDHQSIITVFAHDDDNLDDAGCKIDLTDQMHRWLLEHHPNEKGADVLVTLNRLPDFMEGKTLRYIDGNHRMRAIEVVNSERLVLCKKAGVSMDAWVADGNIGPVEVVRCRWCRMRLVSPIDVASYTNYSSVGVTTNTMDALYIARVHVPLFLESPEGKTALRDMKSNKRVSTTGVPITALSRYIDQKPGVMSLMTTDKARERFLRSACKVGDATWEYMLKIARDNEPLSDKACVTVAISNREYPAVLYCDWSDREMENSRMQEFGTRRYNTNYKNKQSMLIAPMFAGTMRGLPRR